MPKIKLSKVLNFFLIKYIAENIDNIQMIKSNNIKDIILYLKKEIIFLKDNQKDIKLSIIDKKGNNIISYSNYISTIINENELSNLINLLEIEKRNEVEKFWKIISECESYNKLFEEKFLDAIKNSYFEYSLIGISLYEQNNRENYMKGFNECQNRVVKHLFHGTTLEDSKKNIEHFNYSGKLNYGEGIYFTDMIDYILFFNKRNSKNKTLPINSIFSFETAEIYYDKQFEEKFYKNKNEINDLKAFQTYEGLNKIHPDKVVKRDGINFIQFADQINLKMKKDLDIIINYEKGKFISNQYIISDKDQTLPLYKLTLKRNEYCIIWRDPNYGEKNKFSGFLENMKNIIDKEAKINIYFENSVEKALEMVKKKKYNKIILISNIGLDLSGKRFVEVARKLLGYDIFILFFSANNSHLSWIQHFKNALYSKELEFCKEYIMNYNEKGLNKLKAKTEQNYKIKLEFTKNFLEPKFNNNKDLLFNEISENFRKVLIKTLNKNFLKMDINGNVSLTNKYDEEEKEAFIWYLTIIEDEITLFSNKFYLTYNSEINFVYGDNSMKRWKYEKIDNNMNIIYFDCKNYILTEYKKNLIIKEGNKKNKDQIFEFMDFIED